MYDMIIIGAGVAGLTAGIYGARAGKRVLILESNMYGGQIIKSNNVENYPGIKNTTGFQLAKDLYDQATSFGCIIKYEVVTGIEKNMVITSKESYATKTIIIATGLTPKKLNCDNEMRFIGSGISYCATCDGNFFKGKNVAVTGSGNTACEEALYLSSIAKKVYLLVRSPKMHADKYLLDRLRKLENIEMILNARISSFEGKNTLEEVIYSNDGIYKTLKVEGFFIAIGYEPKTEIFSSLIDVDNKGYIISNDCTTNINNIFVAGDVRTKDLRQLITAASDGAIAAHLANLYIDMN